MNRYSTYNTRSNIYYKKNKRIQNIFNLKKLIFPPITDMKINKIMIDTESIKYITFNTSAQEITNIIINSMNDFPCPLDKELNNWISINNQDKVKNLTITEMTAGVGGNVLNFAKFFKFVNAIEINKIRYDYLKSNVKLYEYENVNFYNDNSVDLLINQNNIIQDIVFFDPPWGGRDYKLHKTLRLDFDKFSIESICSELLTKSKTKMIVMKLPSNYDFDFMFETLKIYKIEKYVLDKMVIVIIKLFINNLI
ncbi:RNA methylase [Acanthamoeba polyphaga mimivirus]|uniref:RNA methylase n=6 Tax=Megamimivirinae TaxID=3044648 RepID=A0A2L2DJG4_MIMIV|nr:putative methyltransferase [Megavirus chiliensis]AFX92657.1 putative methyltransferase [Megavirus courdo11]AGD92515.1 putative methyltransferase [Megavirus lba]AVG46311.1 RNA methylase [Acanthamoeba polyphaga mimivirus]AVL93907.1 putative methyltransferase [Megavirus vitis]AEQ32711.1 mRNA cap guanine-N2 methyltransferase [Megavirus chiliensis]